MNEPIQKISPVGQPLEAAPRTPLASASGPAFRALLEKLEASAREVEAASRGVAGPADLPAAVETARTSLENVLSLQDRLREAIQLARLHRAG